MTAGGRCTRRPPAPPSRRPRLTLCARILACAHRLRRRRRGHPHESRHSNPRRVALQRACGGGRARITVARMRRLMHGTDRRGQRVLRAIDHPTLPTFGRTIKRTLLDRARRAGDPRRPSLRGRLQPGTRLVHGQHHDPEAHWPWRDEHHRNRPERRRGVQLRHREHPSGSDRQRSGHPSLQDRRSGEPDAGWCDQRKRRERDQLRGGSEGRRSGRRGRRCAVPQPRLGPRGRRSSALGQ